MNSLKSIGLSLALHWGWIVLVFSAIVLSAASVPAFESDSSRSKRTQRKQQRELRALADKISIYARSVNRRFPTGDVVVSEDDLAQQLRKPPDAVITALNLLLNERKVQRVSLKGYWKLNV